MPNYIDIIGEFFSGSEAIVPTGNDPTVYGDIVWVTTPIAQATLDARAGDVGTTSSEHAYAYTETLAFTVDESKTITLPYAIPNMVVHVMDPAVTEIIGASLISPKGIGWDPGNVSTGEANINNGVLTDLCYNNSASGTPLEGIIYGIDMQTPTSISAMKRYDYSVSYYDINWEFIGTNDSLAAKDTNGRFTHGVNGASWEVIFTASQNTNSTSTDPYFQSFSEKTYRYFGVRCLKSANATYSIISEMELYAGGTSQTVEKKLTVNTDYEYQKISDTQVSISNVSGVETTFKIIVMGS